MYSQLNEATRVVAHRLRLPLVDWEMIAKGLTPRQSLRDDIHPDDWLLYEFTNIALNLYNDYKHWRTRGGVHDEPQ